MSKFNFRIIYRFEKQSIKFDNLIKRVRDFSKDDNNDYTQYRYRIILKNDNLNKKIKNVAQFIFILFNEMKKKCDLFDYDYIRIQ